MIDFMVHELWFMNIIQIYTGTKVQQSAEITKRIQGYLCSRRQIGILNKQISSSQV